MPIRRVFDSAMIGMRKKMHSTVCAYRQCGNPMQQGRDLRRAKYCSAECRRAALKSPPRDCLRSGCGNKLDGDHRRQYCGAECRRIARYGERHVLKIEAAVTRPFTLFERRFVSANYYRIPASEIAAMLGRGKGSVISVYNRLLKPGRAAAA
jgi:hypothetical protein